MRPWALGVGMCAFGKWEREECRWRWGGVPLGLGEASPWEWCGQTISRPTVRLRARLTHLGSRKISLIGRHHSAQNILRAENLCQQLHKLAWFTLAFR